ncbi:MAG: hypothetical protein ACFB0B_12885 [Thermonemataceae bacterium]
MKTLKATLLTNATSSLLMGLPLVLLPMDSATLFGTDTSMVFTLLGTVLLGFGGFVFFVSSQKPIRLALVRLFVYLDLGWLAGSILVVSAQFFSLSFTGYLLVGLSGVWVAIMAFFQHKGIKETNKQAVA